MTGASRRAVRGLPSLRLLALSFAVVGLLFIAVPNGTLDVISDLGEWLGNHTRAPHGDEQLWLSLGFAYMVVITGICLVVQVDVVRYRALLLVLAAGKTASSLATLGFFVFDEQVFAYLLNFLLDGFLVLVALGFWSLAGRSGPAPGCERRPGLTPLSNATLSAICAAMAPGVGPAARRADVHVAGPDRQRLTSASSPRVRPPASSWACSPSEWLPFPGRFCPLVQAAQDDLHRLEHLARSPAPQPAADAQGPLGRLGYAITPRCTERIGFTGARLRADATSPPPSPAPTGPPG